MDPHQQTFRERLTDIADGIPDEDSSDETPLMISFEMYKGHMDKFYPLVKQFNVVADFDLRAPCCAKVVMSVHDMRKIINHENIGKRVMVEDLFINRTGRTHDTDCRN